MALRSLAFGAVAGLALPILCTAQPRGPACVPPDRIGGSPLWPGSGSTAANPAEGENDGVLRKEGLYVSAQGRLCRRADFLTRPIQDQPPPPPQAASPRSLQAGKAVLLSAVAPGAGQWFLGQERWPAYAAVELWAWFQFLDRRREGRDLRKDYRDLAWFVARRVSTGPRTEAGWEYYEALSEFRSSGAFDVDPLSPGIQPETDEETFNGSVWALAREIYLPEDPESPSEEGSEPYQLAQQYYLSRAYGSELAWDWGSNTLHLEEYGNLIQESDEALRRSTIMIGVILANHLLSAVDALASGRLGIRETDEPSVRIHLVPGPFANQNLVLGVRFPDPLLYVH